MIAMNGYFTSPTSPEPDHQMWNNSIIARTLLILWYFLFAGDTVGLTIGLTSCID